MSEATSTLLSNGGKLTRQQLAAVDTPLGTATHRPVPHSEVIEALLETLGFRHIAVVRDEYAVSKDGMKMFGVLREHGLLRRLSAGPGQALQALLAAERAVDRRRPDAAQL